MKLLQTLDDLKIDRGYWYVATPFTVHPDGPAIAVSSAGMVRDSLRRARIRCFVPIWHLNQAADDIGEHPHPFWMGIDTPWMDGAHGLLVVTMRCWERSEGIKMEIERFQAAGKVVYGIEPETLFTQAHGLADRQQGSGNRERGSGIPAWGHAA